MAVDLGAFFQRTAAEQNGEQGDDHGVKAQLHVRILADGCGIAKRRQVCCDAGMKMMFDFFPVLLFFAAYKLYDIYVATAVLIAASAIQTFAHRLYHGRFENNHLITLVLVVLFGGATLMLHDETFIKWKPTVINWLFGAIFLISQFVGKKTVIERMLGGKVALPAPVWTRLNLAWSMFFVLMGALNLYVAFSFDTDTWVNFKLFGLMGLTFVFIIGQSIYLMRHIDVEATQDE